MDRMDDAQFRGEVLSSLSEIKTKLTIVCGPDGNGGRLGAVESRVDELQAEHQRSKGALTAIGFVWPLILGLVEWLIHRK